MSAGAGRAGPLRVLVAMSGGVDSSVAAARLVAAGHDVVGVTLKLWGGPSDQGCCSVSDVDDARRVADRLGVEHHVFNFSEDFDRWVVDPYVAAHQRGATPNPCIACNRHLKFDRLTERAWALGFDAVATGHHAQVVATASGGFRLARAVDRAKDQSYVLYMLGADVLGRLLLPIGSSAKAEVRAEAQRLGLRTADKADSQDVCFIGRSSGRASFLADRMTFTPGRLVDDDGVQVGSVEAVQLVTIGQRRGLGLAGNGEARFATEVDVAAGVVRVGTAADLLVERVQLEDVRWAEAAWTGPVLAQTSAHGAPKPGRFAAGQLIWDEPQRRVAPGQAVVLYEGDTVLGGGVARA